MLGMTKKMDGMSKGEGGRNPRTGLKAGRYLDNRKSGALRANGLLRD
jgi:hypothetical protein